MRRRWAFVLGALALLLLGFAALSAYLLPTLILNQMTQGLPFPVRLEQPPRWSGFLQVTLEGLEVPSPYEGSPPVLSLPRVVLRVPWWGLMIRPLPVELELDSPRVRIEAGLGETLLRQVDFMPTGSAWQSGQEKREAARRFGRIDPGSVKIVPVGLKIHEGRMDLIDPDVRKDAPLYSIGHLEAGLWMTSPFEYPSIHFTLDARFLTPEDRPIGTISARAQAGAGVKRMEGEVKIWHDRLSDFRGIYHDAPDPFTFEAGAGGPVIRWEYKERWIKASMRCRTEGLKMGGKIGDLPWQSVLDAAADAHGTIDLTVQTEGRWGEPGFDVHNRLLSELDWALRERAAAKGVRVPNRIFYGLMAGEKSK